MTEVLTPTQLRVALLVTDGLSNKEIARQLGMRPETVKLHLRHIIRRLGVTNRTGVAMRLHYRVPFLVTPDHRESLHDLTPTQCQILGELVKGLNSKDIGRAVGKREETVKTHLSHAYAILGVDNRTQAARLYRALTEEAAANG
jgi:DNA-binding NarL/FixJ family response regulator